MRRTPSVILLAFLFLAGCYHDRIAGYEVHGIDVSHYQSKIDWATVAAQDIRFVFVKATEGESMKDDHFVGNWEAIGEQNLLRGAYHFFIPSLDPAQQAINFTQSVTLGPGDLPPVLDIEVTNSKSSTEIVEAAQSWITVVENHYGVKPIIYTSFNFYEQHLKGNFDDYPVWIARYGSGDPSLSRDWSFWQYTDRGGVEGIDGYVDLNVFRGTLEALKLLQIPEPIASR